MTYTILYAAGKAPIVYFGDHAEALTQLEGSAADAYNVLVVSEPDHVVEGLRTIGAMTSLYNALTGSTVKKLENKEIGGRRIFTALASKAIDFVPPAEQAESDETDGRTRNYRTGPRYNYSNQPTLLRHLAPRANKPPRAGSKAARLVELMLRDEGMSEAEGCAEIGWSGCSVTAVRAAQRSGFSVWAATIEGRGVVYFARTAGSPF